MDWPQLISDLKTAGLTQQEIAAEGGVSQPSISDLASGKTRRPSFELGDRLRALHAKTMKRKAKEPASKAGA